MPVQRRKTPSGPGGVPPEHLTFARCLAEGMTQEQAYLQAYPGSATWKRTSRQEMGCVLAKNPNVVAELERLRKATRDAWALEQVDVLRETARLAFADIRHVVGINEQGKAYVLMPHELPEDIAKAIASFEVDDLGRIKYKLADKNAALDKLMKHLGLYDKDNAQRAPVLPAEIRLVPLQPIDPKAAAGKPVDDGGDGNG